jgi:hypothetical protein
MLNEMISHAWASSLESVIGSSYEPAWSENHFVAWNREGKHWKSWNPGFWVSLIFASECLHHVNLRRAVSDRSRCSLIWHESARWRC